MKKTLAILAVLLAAFLRDSIPPVQISALRIMSRTRTNSPEVTPLILPFLTNSWFSLRVEATNTLVAFDPALAASYGVNTNRN